MPKLTKDSLEKRFSCQYCGESFRTRQGLSGHIQWKHGKKYKLKIPDLTLEVDEAVKLKQIQQILGLSESTQYAMSSTIIWWGVVQSFCEVFNIELNQQDLKNYLITSLAQINQNEQLKQEITKTLSSLSDK